MNIFEKNYHKAISAILTVPTLKSWLIAVFLLGLIAVICLPIGFYFGILELRLLSLSFLGTIKILVSRLFFPSFAEELIFRVLLLPRETSHISVKKQFIVAVMSIVLYVISHPINAILFYKQALLIFTNPGFLLSTLVLGIALTISYLQSRSIWTPIAIHWIVVVSWLLLFDGYSKLNL